MCLSHPPDGDSFSTSEGIRNRLAEALDDFADGTL